MLIFQRSIDHMKAPVRYGVVSYVVRIISLRLSAFACNYWELKTPSGGRKTPWVISAVEILGNDTVPVSSSLSEAFIDSRCLTRTFLPSTRQFRRRSETINTQIALSDVHFSECPAKQDNNYSGLFPE